MELVNQASVEAGQRSLEQLGAATVAVVREGVRQHYIDDEAQVKQAVRQAQEAAAQQRMLPSRTPTEIAVTVYVLEDLLGARDSDTEHAQATLFTRLEPRTKDPADPDAHMLLHVPVRSGESSQCEIPDNDAPGYVYARLVMDQHDQWYAISRGAVYEYVPASDREDDLSDTAERIQDQDLWQLMDARFPRGLQTITRILGYITDWQTVPQRTITLPIPRPNGNEAAA